jgi:hypothetical protein
MNERSSPRWQPVAWRWNDRRGPWRESDCAPVTLDHARHLCGLVYGVPATPGHFCAHQVVGNKTMLMYRRADT